MEKRIADRFLILLVHREARARPVHRSAELFELIKDDASVLLLPLPDLFKELLASHIMPGDSLLLQVLLDNILRCDARMVGSRNPERFISFHSFFTDEDILDDGV